jgi:hypothetical protein
MIGGVAIVISWTLLLLCFLDIPYHSGVGGLRPVAMSGRSRCLARRRPPSAASDRSRATRTARPVAEGERP